MIHRIVYLDALKGYAILLMVMGHCLAWSFEDWNLVIYNIDKPCNVKMAGFLFQLIYSFHMPLFFIISGYLSYKNNVISLNNVQRKSKRYLIPYILTGFILLGLEGNYGYWFLLSLWELSMLCVLYSIIVTRFETKGSSIIKDILLLLVYYYIVKYTIGIIPVYYNLDFAKCTNYFIPFFFGYVMRKYPLKFDYLTDKKMLTFYLVSFAMMFSFRYWDFRNYDMFNLTGKINHLIFIFMPLIGSLIFIQIFRKGINKHIESMFAYLGGVTLEIYVLHELFVVQIPSVGEFWLSTNLPTLLSTQLVYSFVCSIIAIVFCIVLSKIICRSRLLGSLLFGK